MRRRVLLTGAGTALLVAGCARAASSATGAAAGASGTAPVGTPAESVTPVTRAASWRLVGGFMAPGSVEIRPYRLVVYGSGLAVADAFHRGQLTPAERDALVAGLVRCLADGKAGQRRPGAPMVMDVPATEIVVHSGGHTYTASADGVDELRAQRAYPPRLYDARDLLDAVYRRIVAGGQRYTSSRVRLVAVPVRGDAGSPAPAAPWPAGVPVPTATGTAGVLVRDLDGTPASRALAAFPLASDAVKEWQTYAVPGGAQLRGAVRYRLPDE
jgi:hypothetical protein